MGITASNLTKVYGTQTAVDDVSFEMSTGEVLGFLGPNGAGKTTTMRILTCYLNPTAGSATLDGYDIHDHPEEVRRRIGYLPEGTPLYTDVPVIDYLRLSADLQSVPEPKINDRIQEMMDVCGLGPERHKRIGELSKGFQQRVGLAQALLHDPPVLILDEPTTGLDPNQIVEIRELIKEIGMEKTVMLSSHILKEVEMTCDRILIIDQGRVVADGPTDELREQFMGGTRLRVSVDAPVEADVPAALEGLGGVASVQRTNGTYELSASSEANTAANVFHLCADRSWVLTELTPIESSLEDVFRDLTESPETPADTASAPQSPAEAGASPP
ncbi:ATP-binding cassette domain-containing protein [Salinibacter altiplanensis]|uniref:ATP-binding cassette domain-containing protein n=1 Tax=Salinibacter altiplanensis TaxID=1803181 RepID=UPI000C9FD6A3|nr:ATP-binding cassette domain-containing protein [Salinibacter altiplanensis]